MISRPTVLILGAGASNPYGYPLGGQLVDRIVELTDPKGSGLSRVLAHEVSLKAFHERLRESEVSSIDDFLESNPQFQTIGKLCIAAGLTVWGPSHDHRPNANADWYKYLWGRLHQGAATSNDFRDNHLKIITYNYEMSLERYLSRVLARMYPDLADARENEVVGFLNEVIPFVHLHGTLGNADSVVQPRTDRTTYLDPHFLAQTASGIRIVHEDRSAEYDTAHAWLQEAEIVHLLGFGYHPTNVRRLDLAVQSGRRNEGWLRFGGTAFQTGWAERERAVIAVQMGADWLHQVDCLGYLRERALLE